MTIIDFVLPKMTIYIFRCNSGTKTARVLEIAKFRTVNCGHFNYFISRKSCASSIPKFDTRGGETWNLLNVIGIIGLFFFSVLFCRNDGV